MIEVNLVPDVKQELIKAKRIRTVVVSTAVVVGIAAVGIVVLLALYFYLGQTVRSNIANGQIEDKFEQLENVEGLEKTLTIQHQLSMLDEHHAGKNVTSRFFDLLAAINPPAPNQVSFSLARIESEEKMIRLEGQTSSYGAAEVLKKTILGTELRFREGDDKTQTVPITKSVETGEFSFGEDVSGKKVLRFSLTFVYHEALLAQTSKDAIIVRPDRQNVTDSYLRLPEGLFSDRAVDQGGAQ